MGMRSRNIHIMFESQIHVARPKETVPGILLEQFRNAGYTIVTTSSRAATPLFKATLPRKMVLVLGQERDGLSDAALSSADMSVSIDGTGNVESLNVSVATGVLLAEWWRQNKA